MMRAILYDWDRGLQSDLVVPGQYRATVSGTTEPCWMIDIESLDQLEQIARSYGAIQLMPPRPDF